MAKFARTVLDLRNPEDDSIHSFNRGDDAPGWATKLLKGNPHALESDPEEGSLDEVVAQTEDERNLTRRQVEAANATAARTGDDDAPPGSQPIDRMNSGELTDWLNERGLDTSGNRDTKLARAQEYTAGGSAGGGAVDPADAPVV